MTVDVKRNPYTQRQIERAIKAAMACGLRVVGVRPDGTVLTEAGTASVPEPKLVDARVKLGVSR